MPDEAPANAPEETDISEEEDEKLPFPTARVVRMLRASMQNEHQISSEVKRNANLLLGDVISDIAKAMDKEVYFTLGVEHFNSAARKYKLIDLQSKRMETIRRLLEKQRAELDQAIYEIEHSAD